jgi:hypothetical protein
MMEQSFVISDYCILRKNRVVHNGSTIFESDETTVSGFLTAIYRHVGISYPKFHKMDNLSKLGFLAAEVLLRHRNLKEKYEGDKIGILLSNAASSIDTDRNHQQSINNRLDYFPSPSVFVYTLANIVIGEISIRHGFFGEGTFFIEESFNPVRMHDYVSQLLEEEVVHCCVTGWVELDRDRCEAALYLVQKSDIHPDGIANFDPAVMNDIYLLRT